MLEPIKERERLRHAIAGIVGCVLLASCTKTDTDGSSKYSPSIRNGDSYRFSELQLKRMAETHLDRDSFLRYVETKWPISRLKAYCTPENRWPGECQNLVKLNDLFGDIAVHEGKSDRFDRIYVYVCEDDGKNNYYGEAGTEWKRWEYSLNVCRGQDRWAIIECLPNDFVDNLAKYVSRPTTPVSKAK